MPVLGRTFHKACFTSLACVAGVTVAAAGPDVKSTPRDHAAPSTLALPSRAMVWQSLPKLTFWWQGAQPAQPSPAQPAPAQPAQPAQPAPAPAPEQAPAQPAEGAPAPAPAPAAPEAQPAAPAGDQAAPTDADVIAQAEAELSSGESAEEGEVIVVTGSAIERDETTTPAPVSVVDKAELDASGMVSVADILQNLPSQSNAINVQFNNGGDGSARVNLRGLGEDRTLVLVNGRRHVNGGLGANASVDLNAIPLAIIKRVEVLKDGASAVYGSDALGGVVNIITRDDFQGVEGNVYTGTTQRGDGTVIDVSVVAGQASKRGNVVFSAGYSDQQPIFAGERDFSEVAYVYDFADGIEATDGSFTTPNGFIGDTNIENGKPLCPNQDQTGCTPDGKGGFRDFDDGGVSDKGLGDLYNFQPENYLLTPLRRYNAFSTGNYRFHDNVRGFFEASYMNRKSVQQLAPEPLVTLNEEIPFSEGSIYNPTGRDLFYVGRRMTEGGPRIFSQSVDTFRVVAGLDGRLPIEQLRGWKWEGSFNYGRTQGTETNKGRFVRSRVREAIGPSFRDDNGVPRCGTDEENPGSPDCVPLDLLGGEGTITDEMLDYITYTGILEGFTQQRTWLGQLSGPITTTPWGGDLMLAVGGDFRQEEGGQQPDPNTATGNTTGNKVEPTKGKYDVVEGFGEISFVPVRDQPWAKLLQVDFAARVVDYSTFGNAFTWKAGGLYRLPMGLAARGTYSTAFRAPSIGELYDGVGDDFPNIGDPCDTSDGPIADANVRANCAAEINDSETFTDGRSQMPARIGGNRDLDAETAKVWTTGLVYEPAFAEGLGVSVDYFNVKIEDSIQSAGASILLANCYNLPPERRTDCDKIIRDPASGIILSIIDTQTNIGANETDGIDFNINYTYEFPQVGRFRHNFEGTWLNHIKEVFPSRTVDGVGVYDLADGGEGGVYPRWKFNFTTLWGYREFGLGANARYIGSLRECDQNDCQQENADMLDRKVDANVTGDAFATYSLKSPLGSSALTIGVNNVTDQNPPVIYNGFLATSDASTYDFLGRFFYARLTQSF